MTMRERMLAVIQGREHDRVPFVQYDGLAGPTEEIWSVIGRENMGIIRWTSVHRQEHPNCRFESEPVEKNGRKGERTTLHTPLGSLVEEKLFEPAFGTGARHKHFVSEVEDYRVLAAYLRDVTILPGHEPFLRAQAEIGDDGLPMVAVGRTPFQQTWIQWASLEDFCVHLHEYPDAVEECLSLMADIQRGIHEVVRDAADLLPIPFVDIPDNITAPAIGPKYFERYCAPLYSDLADLLSEKGIPLFVHMDGDLRALWGAIDRSGVRGIDSFSPPPDNDTSVADALENWPYMRLFMNFPSSVHLAEPDAIYAATMEILEQAGRSGRLEIQISENMPLGMWRKSFPEIVHAIHDFGGPLGGGD